VMLFVFAFVDIAWDARDFLLLAFAIAVCHDMPLRRSPPAAVIAEAPAQTRALDLVRA
jgi:hypothetical protein